MLEGALDKWIGHLGAPYQTDDVSRNVAIVDATGTEDLDAISDFDLERFPGTTRRVTILRGLVNPQLKIGITFSRVTGINGNTLRIVLEHAKARELSSGLASELLRIIGTQPYNKWTKGGGLFPIIGFLIAAASFALGMGGMKNHWWGLPLFVGSFLIGVFSMGAASATRYSDFESNAMEERTDWAVWILRALIAAMLSLLLKGAYDLATRSPPNTDDKAEVPAPAPRQR
jgi:hypothetical protein